MAAQKNAPLPDGLSVAGYCIVKTIACGGFSIVYLARDGDGNAVAIKEYLPSELALRGPGALVPLITAANAPLFRLGLRCFFDEARALALVKHPNVVRALDFFRANHSAYLVMAYEPGHTLQEHIARRRANGTKMREAWIVSTFIEVINGLRAVHAHKLLHLDLKPANILLRPGGQPVLLDIGGMRQSAAVQLTGRAVMPTVTPAFAAPELHGGSPGPWSDAYSIGATMFACMVGAPPQPANERYIEDRTDASLVGVAGIYSAPLADLVRWCLRLDALARPQSLLALQLRLRLNRVVIARDLARCVVL
ncbi:MAG: serine/threonine protein kinase [Janthinobacterium sp.]|jgi:serine/threonine protein kinase